MTTPFAYSGQVSQPLRETGVRERTSTIAGRAGESHGISFAPGEFITMEVDPQLREAEAEAKVPLPSHSTASAFLGPGEARGEEKSAAAFAQHRFPFLGPGKASGEEGEARQGKRNLPITVRPG